MGGCTILNFYRQLRGVGAGGVDYKIYSALSILSILRPLPYRVAPPREVAHVLLLWYPEKNSGKSPDRSGHCRNTVQKTQNKIRRKIKKSSYFGGSGTALNTLKRLSSQV